MARPELANNTDTAKETHRSNDATNAWIGGSLYNNPALFTELAQSKHDTTAGLLPSFQITEHYQAGATTDVTMKVDGQDRHFQVHVPKDYDGSKPMPLMIVYNGLGYGYKGMPGGGKGMEEFTGLSKKADSEKFIVAYPDGAGLAHGYNNGQEPLTSADDVKFTSKMIDSLQKDLNVDKDRIYLAGLSEGGSFVHRAAAELSDKIAAVADVSGFMTGTEKTPTHHVSALSIHSRDDDMIPYDGTKSLLKDHWIKGQLMETLGFHGESAKYTEDHYRNVDGMNAAPQIKDTLAPDGTKVHVEDSVNKKDGTEVMQVTVEKRGHGWFGSSDSPGALSATDTVVDFLLRQKRAHGN